MSFIRKMSDFTPIMVSQEPQTEATPQSPAQPQTNRGIANTADGFVTDNPTDFYRMIQQQTAPQVYGQMLHTPEQTVDPTALFDYVANVQEPQPPTPPEPSESDLAKMVEDFAERKTASREFGLNKGWAKDTVEKLSDAVSEGQKTQDDIQDAKDDSDDLRKES